MTCFSFSFSSAESRYRFKRCFLVLEGGKKNFEIARWRGNTEGSRKNWNPREPIKISPLFLGHPSFIFPMTIMSHSPEREYLTYIAYYLGITSNSCYLRVRAHRRTVRTVTNITLEKQSSLRNSYCDSRESAPRVSASAGARNRSEKIFLLKLPDPRIRFRVFANLFHS